MKKITQKTFILIVTIILTLNLSACSKKETTKDNETETQTTINTMTPEAETSDEDTEGTDNDIDTPDTDDGDTETGDENNEGGEVEDAKPETPKPAEEPAQKTDEEKVLEYVTNNSSALESEFESQFTSKTGIGCDCTIYASGTTVVLSCNIAGYNDVDANTAAKIKILAGTMTSTAKSVLTTLNSEESAISGVSFKVCEEDGDLITTINVNE